MNTNEAKVVLELFGVSLFAVVHTSGGFVLALKPSATQLGLCHSLPLGQAALAVAGVKFSDSILPGEVVS